MNESSNPTGDQTVSMNATQRISVDSPEKTQAISGTQCAVCKTPNPPSEAYCVDCGFLLTQPVGEEIPEPPAPPVAKLVAVDCSREFPLHNGENTVGRRDADVLISDQTVSRLHAKITVVDGVSVLEDNGSTNGTWVDTRKVEPGDKVTLADGSRLRFGSYVVDFAAPSVLSEVTQCPDESATMPDQESEAVSESEAETVEESPAAEPVVAATVYGILRSKDGTAYSVTSTSVRVGRRPDVNDLVVPDPYCSGVHARLETNEGVLVVTDLGSSNGTFVNGIRLEPNAARDLQTGDEVIFGQSVFVVEGAQQ